MAINEGLKTGSWIGQPVADKQGRYEVLSIIGRGGMGEVCLARDHHMARTIAIKVVHFGELTNEKTQKDYVRRFRREAQVTAGLDSPFVVKVYEYEVEENGIAYLTMERLHGQDMEGYLSGLSERRVGPEGHREFFGYCAQVAAAIAMAHHSGVVHRDLKPSNLFLVRQPNGTYSIKVLDFGIARLTMDAAQSPQDQGRTEANVFMGTVEYMSPEQISRPPGVEVGPETDIFSLGCVMFQALTGRSPFNSDEQASSGTLAEMVTRLKAIQETAAEEAGRLPKSLSRECRAFIMRMLDRRPEKRPKAIEVSNFFSKQAGISQYEDPAAPAGPTSIMLVAGLDQSPTEDDPAAAGEGRATPQTPRQPPALALEPSGRPATLAAITGDIRVRGIPFKLPFTRTQFLGAAAAIFSGGLIALALHVRHLGDQRAPQSASRPPVVTSILVDASSLATTDASHSNVTNVEEDAGVANDAADRTFALGNEDAGDTTSQPEPHRHGRRTLTDDERILRRARRALELQCCEHQPVAEALGISTCEFADDSAAYRRLRCGHH